MATSSQKEKEIFFTRLDQLDKLALEIDEDVGNDHTLEWKRSSPNIPLPNSRPDQQIASNSPVRPSSSLASIRRQPSSPLSTRKMPPRASSHKPGSEKLLWKPAKKQGGKKSLQLQPEDAQIFRGLTFYFVPNNDIAVPRKKRIEKVQEYGALWAKDWSTEVTHVIVDGNLRLNDVTKAIGPDRLKPDHIIVNETYPPDCIKFGVLLPTHPVKFQLTSDVAQSKLGTEKHCTIEKTMQGAPKVCTHATDAEPLAAIPHDEEHDHAAPDNSGFTSFKAPKEAEDGGVAKDLGVKKADELDSIVAEVQETADLPLDSEDDGFELSSYTSSSDSEGTQQKKPKEKKPKTSDSSSKFVELKRSFSCMRKNESTDKSSNPNSKTIEKLDKMALYYNRIGDHWRTTAYRKCITALKRQSDHILTREQALKIFGIGERLAIKIEEIALTNRLRRLESTELDSNDQLLQLFMGIYQVGLPTASRWIAQGHKSLEDLRSKADLSQNQKIGIDHYDDFLARIPRSEVKAHSDIVRKACAMADAKIQLIVGGSYRRGAADCGDIDLIITKENASLEEIRTILTKTVIPHLFDEGFLKVGLATSSSKLQDHGSKWHGASALPGSTVWRRIDFLFVPWDEIGAALIYFTGNDIFNRSIRLLAGRRKMRLNQHGLYGDVMRGEKRQRITQGKLLEGRSEERIFEILGVPWRPPEHRIC